MRSAFRVAAAGCLLLGVGAARAAASSPPGELALALTTGVGTDELVVFRTDAPAVVKSRVHLSGLQVGERLLGIDVYQRDFKVYALSDQSRLYTVDPATGVCTIVGAGPVPFSPPLAGSRFEIEMGTQYLSEMRVVSDADENRYVTPQLASNNGAYLAFNYAPPIGTTPHVVALAAVYYPPGKFRTTGAHEVNLYYGIDAQTSGVVVDVGSSEFVAQIAPVGPLGFTLGGVQGFDASLFTRDAYLAATPSGQSTPRLYSVSLATGAATDLGAMTFDGTTGPVTSFCLLPPAPISVRLFSDQFHSYSTTIVPGAIATPKSSPTPKDYPYRSGSFAFSPSLSALVKAAEIDTVGTVAFGISADFDYHATTPSGSIAGLDAAQPMSMAFTGAGDVVVTNGARVVDVRTSPFAVVADHAAAYASGDANAGRTPSIVATSPALGLAAGQVIGIDLKDTLNQTTFTMDPAVALLTSLGPTGLNWTGTNAASTLLANGGVLLVYEEPTSATLNYALIEPRTGTAMPLGYSDALPNGEHLVGIADGVLATGPVDNFKVVSSKHKLAITAPKKAGLAVELDADGFVGPIDATVVLTSKDAWGFNGQRQMTAPVDARTNINFSDPDALAAATLSFAGVTANGLTLSFAGAGAHSVDLSGCKLTNCTVALGTNPANVLSIHGCTIGTLKCTGSGDVKIDAAAGDSGSVLPKLVLALAAGDVTIGGGGARTSLGNVGIKIADAGKTSATVAFVDADLHGPTNVACGGGDDVLVLNGVVSGGGFVADGGKGADTLSLGVGTSVATSGSLCFKGFESAPSAEVTLTSHESPGVVLTFNVATHRVELDGVDPFIGFAKTKCVGSKILMTGGLNSARRTSLRLTDDLVSRTTVATVLTQDERVAPGGGTFTFGP